MFNWLLKSSFAQNMVSDAISHGAVLLGGILLAHGFIQCAPGAAAAGTCGDYNGYLGSAIFLGGLAYKWFENISQATTKTALATAATNPSAVVTNTGAFKAMSAVDQTAALNRSQLGR